MRTSNKVSVFSYSITRPYPFAWFTPVVVAGGIVLTVLFSFVAVASNGYELQTIYTTDPNGTEGEREWFTRPPFSWISSPNTLCQPSLLSIGGSYRTARRGLSYTLTAIEAGLDDANKAYLLPSLAYKNTTLQGCDVTGIYVTLARINGLELKKDYLPWGDTTAAATIRCSLQSAHGALHLNFSTSLPPVGASMLGVEPTAATTGAGTFATIVDNFVYHKNTGDTDLWYGMSLTTSWYMQLSRAMGYSSLENGETFSTGSFALLRSKLASNYMRFTTLQDWTDSTSTYHSYGIPGISITADAFGKSYHSLLLSDFGMRDPSINPLASETGIRYLQSRDDVELASAASKAFNMSVPGTIPPVLEDTQHLPDLRASNGTTLFAEYLCSVPRKKNGMNLVFPVLLANIEFLQACWQLFSLSVAWWLARKDDQTDYCAGCLYARQNTEETGTEATETGACSEWWSNGQRYWYHGETITS